MEYGYARVSTKEQNEQRQMIALQGFGIAGEAIYLDKQSGKDFARSQYQKLLRKLKKDDPHVILTPKSRKPVDVARISAMVRTLLVRGGIETKSLSVLRSNANIRRDKQELLAFVRDAGCVTIKAVMERFGYTESAAHNRLHALVEDGALTHVSSGYYPSDEIVPPERHAQAVLDYIGREKVAYCADVANLLHIGKRPAAKLLAALVRAGELTLEKGSKQYRVSEPEEEECCILVTR